MGKLFGIIGTGNMGGALAAAACQGAGSSAVLLANRTAAKAAQLAAQLGCESGDNAQIAREAKYIMLGVKPQMMEGLLSALRPILQQRSDRFILVTMAAGLSMEKISTMAGGHYPVLRIMPNTPVSIGRGMVLYCANDLVTQEDLTVFLRSMESAGSFDALEEHLIDAGSCVAGCGPAFADLFVEALADGGVACGLPRAKAMQYAAQMLLGAASLQLESKQHPGCLKDAVCSPGGSTIQGVRALEAAGFRSSVMEAVIAAFEKTKQLGK